MVLDHAISCFEKRSSDIARRATGTGTSRNSAATRLLVRGDCAARVAGGRQSMVSSATSLMLPIAGTSVARAPLSRHRRNAAPASRTCSIVFTISCCTRSAESRPRCAADAVIAARVSGSIASEKREANRMARSARKRSSRIRSFASPTARSTLRSRSPRPSNGSRRSFVAGRQAIALMVKSRRARSSSRLAPNSTSACRPSVRTSRRKVVTSCATPASSRMLTVPNRMPTGMVRRLPKSAWTSSGRAEVARSQSRGCPPRRESRMAPPTHHASNPARSRRSAMSRTLRVAGSLCMSVANEEQVQRSGQTTRISS